MEKLIVLSDASKITGIGEKTLHNAIQAGELKAAKIGRYWRLRESDLSQWLEGKFVQSELPQAA